MQGSGLELREPDSDRRTTSLQYVILIIVAGSLAGRAGDVMMVNPRDGKAATCRKTPPKPLGHNRKPALAVTSRRVEPGRAKIKNSYGFFQDHGEERYEAASDKSPAS